MERFYCFPFFWLEENTRRKERKKSSETHINIFFSQVMRKPYEKRTKVKEKREKRRD